MPKKHKHRRKISETEPAPPWFRLEKYETEKHLTPIEWFANLLARKVVELCLRPGLRVPMSGLVGDDVWNCWVLGDGELALRRAEEDHCIKRCIALL